MSISYSRSVVWFVLAAGFALALLTPAGFASAAFDQGRVSITVDDGWKNAYESIMGEAQVFGSYKTTQYIYADAMNQVHGPIYMNAEEVKNLYDAGHEIGGHSKTHRNLVGLSGAALQAELVDSKSDIEDAIGAPGGVKTFAYPYGSYDNALITAVQNAGYENARGVDQGFNTEESLADIPYRLMIQHVTGDTQIAEIKNWIDEAKTTNAWLILMFHEIVESVPNDCDGESGQNDAGAESECTTRALAQAVTAYLEQEQVCVQTVSQVFSREGCSAAPTPTSFTITASSGANGTLTPSGAVSVASSSNQTFTIAPNSGYDVATLTIDGSTIATTTSYTFSNVGANHTIDVSFAALASTTATTTPPVIEEPAPNPEPTEEPRRRGGSIRRTVNPVGGIVLGAATVNIGLSANQIESIVRLLQSFGVDPKTIQLVRSAFRS